MPSVVYDTKPTRELTDVPALAEWFAITSTPSRQYESLSVVADPSSCTPDQTACFVDDTAKPNDNLDAPLRDAGAVVSVPGATKIVALPAGGLNPRPVTLKLPVEP